MRHWLTRTGFGLTLAAGLMVASVHAADPVDPKAAPATDPKADPKVDPKADPKDDPKADPKVDPKADPKDPIDTTPAPATTGAVVSGSGTKWLNYVSVNNVVAEVRSVSDGTITLRVYWDTAQKGTSRGNRGSRSSIYGGHHHVNPLQQAMRSARNVKVVHQHHDYDVGYFPDTLVRGKIAASSADTTTSSKTAHVPTELTPGTIVQALLIRDKSIAVKDLKETDLKVKSITAMGQNPNYAADGGTAKNNKKKNK